MKAFLLSIVAGLLALSSFGADRILSKSIAANTATNVLSGGRYVIKEIYFQNSDLTNSARIKVYDSSNAVTNYVVAASTTYSTVTTNFSTVWTNESGLLMTNTFNGVATIATTVSAATNERPKLVEFTVPKSDNRTLTRLGITPLRGVLVISDYAGVLEITYDQMD
jgi:hypothetical protein